MAQQLVVNASQIKQQIDKLLSRIFDSDEHVFIERDGDKVAVMMPIQEYEDYRRLAAAARHKERVRVFNIEAEKQGLTEEQLFAELKETRRQINKETYGDLFDQSQA